MRKLLISRTKTRINIVLRVLLLDLVILSSGCAHAQLNLPPQIYNYQKSAKPGDVVYFEGANLANASAYLVGYRQLQTYTSYSDNNFTAQLPSSVKGALAVYIVNKNGTSPVYYLNAAQPYNLEATQVAPGAPFRLMGKNLYLTGYKPIVTIGGQTAALNLARSTETMLIGTVPISLNTGPAAITVDNGNGSGPTALLEAVSVIAGSSADPFDLGVGWASSFAPIAAITIDPITNSHVSPHMVGDGTTDNTAALQAAVNYVHEIGGGTITIPTGTYYLAGMVIMSSNVVISGAGTAQTFVTYPASSYPIVAYGEDLVGLTNLTISTASKTNNNNVFFCNLTRSFLKNVVISSVNGQQIYAYKNTNFAIENSTLTQTGIGYQGQGVIYLANSEGLIVTGNTLDFQAGYAMNILGTNDSYIGGNNIIIDASAQNTLIPGQTDAQSAYSYYTSHGLVLDFNRRVTVDCNSFNVVNGPFTNIYRNDGEAIPYFIHERGPNSVKPPITRAEPIIATNKIRKCFSGWASILLMPPVSSVRRSRVSLRSMVSSSFKKPASIG